MIKQMYLLLIVVFCTSIAQSQVIFSDPPFINPETEIEIIFDAAEGNAGLKDCNCKVYLHTGVITSQSSGLADWRYVQGDWGQVQPALEMTKVSDNIYTYRMTPRSFYGVPQGEELQNLAFVFRNGDGSQAGRAPDGGDIYLDIVSPTQGLQGILQQPAPSVIIEEGQTTITIIAHSSKQAQWLIIDRSSNGDTTYLAGQHTRLEYSLPVIENGSTVHQVQIEATDGSETIELGFEYIIVPETEVRDPDVDTPQGFTVLPDGTIRLKLVAPGKKNVQVLSNNNEFKITDQSQMFRSSNGDFFWIDINHSDNSDWFLYQYLIDGTLTVADPMSSLVLDPWNDGGINNSYFPAYPDQTDGIVTAEKISGHTYDWKYDNFVKPNNAELVVYETLMRDFLASHNYEDLMDTLDYLDRLGINAIQLMPVQEFEGNDSWGYNPSFHKALDKYYGDPIQFKQFVDAAHEKGIAVILDVVYNHAFSQSPLCQMYWDNNAFKPTEDNPWLNVDARHPFNVGYDFNHESRYTQEWVKDVMHYWLEEYHVDGFRFDLSKGFTQVNNPNDVGQWGAYDASRISILKDYADDLWSYDEDFYVILEHFADNAEEKELANYGMMLWGNINYNYGEAVMGYTSTSGLASGLHTSRGFDEPHLVSYMESHDEERNMFRALNSGNSSADYDTRDFDTAIDRLKLANTFFLTLPGPKMIWQFGELGYDFSINRCVNGTINNNCRLDRKPIRWDYANDSKRMELYQHIDQLLDIRETYDLSTVDNIKQLLNGSVKKVELRKGGLTLFIVGNFDVVEQSTGLEFSSKNEWFELYTGQVVNNTDDPVSVTLAPGEYRIYTNQEIVVSTDNIALENSQVSVFPNPATSSLQIDSALKVAGVKVYDQLGQLFMDASLDNNRLDINELPNGVYTLIVQFDEGYSTVRFIKI